MYTIEILSYGEVVKVFNETKKAKAKSLYYKYAGIEHLYTKVTYNGTVLNTAKAEKHFARMNKECYPSLQLVQPWRRV